MIKVLLLRNVLPNSKFGGIRKHCQELYELFKNDSQIKILPVENLSNHLVPLLHKRVYYWKQLYQYIKCSDCDIVHVHGFATLDIIQVFVVAYILKKKIVYSPHYHPFKYLQHPLFGRLYFYCCLRFFLNLATSIITITKNDTDFFVHFHKNVQKIPHQFTPFVNEHMVIEKKKNMILFVGRNEENKGLFHLKRLNKQYEIHLVTGAGKFDRDDYIIHTNISNEELCLLYKQASLVVIPSRYEAFSYVALESFAHGTPVVMSNTVMIADYLKGISGFSTFNFGDEDGFLKAVDKTIGVPVDTEKILSIFSADKIQQQYKNVYLNVMK